MPAQPDPAEISSADQPQPSDYRRSRTSDWRKTPWPINEILLETLVMSGRKDTEIATIWNVDADDVRDLREAYGF